MKAESGAVSKVSSKCFYLSTCLIGKDFLSLILEVLRTSIKSAPIIVPPPGSFSMACKVVSKYFGLKIFQCENSKMVLSPLTL